MLSLSWNCLEVSLFVNFLFLFLQYLTLSIDKEQHPLNFYPYPSYVYKNTKKYIEIATTMSAFKKT